MTGADWRPTSSPETMRRRAAMLERARAYFASEQVIEVQTPLLSASTASEPQIESIAALPARGRPLYLQTSPEYAMKRLLAAGVGDCYQICPVFRDGESGRLHNPEFTMIEWYRVGYDVAGMQRDVLRLVGAVIGELRTLAPARHVSYREAIAAACGLDCRTASPDEIAALLRTHGVAPAATADWDRDTWLDLLMATVVGPRQGNDAPVFVHDYPAGQAALARLRDDRDGWPVAERFELYIDGIELANGFHELGDAEEQRRRFEQDLATRRRRGQRLTPLDERFLAALEQGLPDCAGVALGFDRLVMVALRLPSIDDAMTFPMDRA
ncbi:MAG TPA: EF-P lysine aminoacylase EpmA [Steroidobacteraceae bacterium]|nr:EF-P lysine aminoacylase EpmA [Steroidobacteraceae bacterium]